MANNKVSDPKTARELFLYPEFFKLLGKELKDALKDTKITVSEFGWADFYERDLSIAREKELIEIPQEGNCIVTIVATGTAYIRLDNPNVTRFDLRLNPRLYGVPFKRLFLDNDAQAGKNLIILVGKGDFNVDRENVEDETHDINNYDIISFDLAFARSEDKFTIDARSITLLDKPNDNWSIQLNSNKNDSIDGADLDIGDIIAGDQSRIAGYYKYLYFTNVAGSGTVRFFISRDLPFRSPTDYEEEYALVDPSTAPTVPPVVGFPSLEASNWEFKQRLDTESLVTNIIKSGSTLICVGKSGKVYKSTDYGDTWSELSDINPPSTDYMSKLVIQSDARWGVTFGQTGLEQYPKYCYTTDYGASWNEASLPIYAGYEIYDLADLVYLGNNTLVESMPGYNEMRIYRSTNNGVDWSNVTVVSGTALLSYGIISLGSGVCLVGGGNGIIAKSTDYAGSFTVKLNYGSKNVRCFCDLGSNGILAGMDERIYKSTDSGDSWTYIESLTANIYGFENLGSGTVLAILSNGHIWKSTDYGDTWSDLGQVNSETVGYSVFRASDSVVLGVFDGGKIYKPE